MWWRTLIQLMYPCAENGHKQSERERSQSSTNDICVDRCFFVVDVTEFVKTVADGPWHFPFVIFQLPLR
jgi:hypothetical protein